MFRTLADLDRFFTLLLPRAQAADTALAERIADSYRGPHWRVERARCWTFEVTTTAGSTEPPPLRLRATVRFPGSDLAHVTRVISGTP